MKSELFNREFNKIFKLLANESAPGLLKLELELYKKLWNIFLVGDSYYFILNHHSLAFHVVSKEIEDVLGYHPSEFNIPFMFGILHPEDHPWFLTIGRNMNFPFHFLDNYRETIILYR
jgi:hypothetical protein